MGEDGQVLVGVDAVDPVLMGGATFKGFCLAIPGLSGNGTYELVDSEQFDDRRLHKHIERRRRQRGLVNSLVNRRS